VASQVRFVARAQYSNPPKYGAHLVDTVLSNPTLKNMWFNEMRIMSNRISGIRKALFDKLVALGADPNDWTHVINQIGMFAYTVSIYYLRVLIITSVAYLRRIIIYI
jgi:aspartate/tyrosine/aromatic aminotransferase